MLVPLSPETRTQYAALTTGVGAAELAQRTQIELTGSDRATFLNNFCTNDIKRLTPGTGCEAFITSVQGRTIGFVSVFCDRESIVMETVAGQADTLISHLDRYLISEDVQLCDRSDIWSEILVSGRQSDELLSRASDETLPATELGHVDCTICSVDASLRRVALTGLTCFLLSCRRSEIATLRERLSEVGAMICGGEAVEICRVEQGTPQFGRDITDKNLPQEVNRNRQAISFTKGCYLGQETVARIDALGHVNRLLVAVKFDGDGIPDAGTELVADGKSVGQVTSAVYSPLVEAPLALAYVRTARSEVGSQLTSDFGAVEVIELPRK